MNKEFLVVLLEKDIRELELLTEGFETLEIFPKPILQLARQKAENIIKNLEELEKIKIVNELKIESEKIQTKEEFSKNEVELISENDLKSVDEKVESKESIIPEIIEDEEIVEKEPADFMENIKDYRIQGKMTEEKPEIETAQIEPESVNETSLIEKMTFAEGTEVPEKEEIKETIKQESISINHTDEQENILNSVNENIKIDDIRMAINIGDRFRFQRELFGGNGEVMNKTIAYLNQLAKYDEAISFLNNKFGWEKDNQHAEDFLQIVRRRYL